MSFSTLMLGPFWSPRLCFLFPTRSSFLFLAAPGLKPRSLWFNGSKPSITELHPNISFHFASLTAASFSEQAVPITPSWGPWRDSVRTHFPHPPYCIKRPAGEVSSQGLRGRESVCWTSPREVVLNLPFAATPWYTSSCCSDPTPTIKLFLLALRNCNFATDMNRI